MRKIPHLIGLSLLCILAGLNPAYAESSKWIELTADFPSDIVFENEISVELQNCKTVEYEIISAEIAGSFEGELTVEYPADAISITDDSPEVTTLPLTVSVGPTSSDSEVSAGSTGEDTD